MRYILAAASAALLSASPAAAAQVIETRTITNYAPGNTISFSLESAGLYRLTGDFDVPTAASGYSWQGACAGGRLPSEPGFSCGRFEFRETFELAPALQFSQDFFIRQGNTLQGEPGFYTFFDFGGGLRLFFEAPGLILVPEIRLTLSLVESAVPEPAVWVTLIAGFGLAGSAIRRRPRLTALS